MALAAGGLLTNGDRCRFCELCSVNCYFYTVQCALQLAIVQCQLCTSNCTVYSVHFLKCTRTTVLCTELKEGLDLVPAAASLILE